jgi:carbonic anhydrase/acetyltransferase-like protein (isoleucine patch superfamily)
LGLGIARVLPGCAPRCRLAESAAGVLAARRAEGQFALDVSVSSRDDPGMGILSDELRAIYSAARAEMQSRWARDLPDSELVLDDRWQRAARLGFGRDSSIYQSAYVYGTPRVGHDVWVGPLTLLDATGGLTIGDFVTISAGVQIYTHDTVARTVSGGVAPIDRSPVTIGDRTYVGSQTVVARGVSIGNGCVIGANSFVNRDIPDEAFAVGSPCRVIGKVVIVDGRVELRASDLAATGAPDHS